MEDENFFMRQANPNDFEELVCLLSQLTEVGDPKVINIPDDIYNNIYVAISKINDNLIGCITLLVEHKIIHQGSKVGHIEDVVVDKNYRKTGVGQSLLDYVIDISRNVGC